MTRLTDNEKDDRKLAAVTNYISAYNSYQSALRRYGPSTTESYEAWRLLLQAQRRYKKVAKQYASG